MKVLALDQSSHVTGYAIFSDGVLTKYSKFSFDNSNLDNRLMKFRDKIEELIKENEIDEVIFEDVQLQSNIGDNVATFKTLSEVYGVLSELLERMNIPHSSVISTSWKTALKITGRNRTEQKKNAQLYVNNKYGIKAIQDICDAICIGEYYVNKPNDCAW